MSQRSPEHPRSISHHEWLRLLDLRFPQGHNPWRDIYNEETTQKLGKIIQVREEGELFRLRSALAQAAEMMSTFPTVFGGIAARSAKEEWKGQTTAKVSNLLDHLQKADQFSPEHLGQPQYRPQTEALKIQLQEYLSTLDSLTKDDLESRRATLHADFLQFVVDRLTEVFAQFRPREEIKRASAGRVYGTFVDFIRAAARAYLMVNYPKYRLSPKKYENLNRQIQNAVARAKGDFEQYHRRK